VLLSDIQPVGLEETLLSEIIRRLVIPYIAAPLLPAVKCHVATRAIPARFH